ncbi:MAG: alpha/beta hydrolase [Acidimicrobiales bacterium]
MQTTEITFSSGPETLAGTLSVGGRTQPGPAVLLLSGSGPIDRNSNMKKLAIGVMGQLADHLGREGLTSFRYDKRGIGASGGDYISTGFHHNVADAAAAVEALRARPEVDPGRVFVAGHSEGALIATELAAADRELAGIVLLAGTATRGEQVLRWQAEHVGDSLPGPVKLLLKVLRKDIVTTQAKRLAQIKATSTDTARIQLVKINAKWFREFMAHDPAPSLQAISAPVLALTGAKDIQVDPGDVERICQLVPSPCTGQVLDDLTHLLRTETGPPSVRTYKKQAKRPIDPTLLATTSAWIHEQAPLPTQGRHHESL